MKKRLLVPAVLLLVVSLASGCTVFLGPESEATITVVAGEQRATQTPFLSLPVEQETPAPQATIKPTSTPIPTPVPTNTLVPPPLPTAMPSTVASPTPSHTPAPLVAGSFESIVFALESAASASLYPSGATFPAGMSVVHARWRYNDMADGDPYRAAWYFEGTPIEVIEATWDEALLRKDGWARFLALERQGGLEQGNYRLELFIADRLVQQAEFYIGEMSGSSSTSSLPIVAASAEALPPVIPGGTVLDAVWSAVRLRVVDDGGEVVSVGSGTVVDPRGWILTSLHTVADVATGKLWNSEGEAHVEIVRDPGLSPDFSYVAELRNWDRDLDVAVMEITTDAFGRQAGQELSLPSVPLGSSDDTALPLLASVTIIGFLGSGPGPVAVTESRVEGRRRLEDGAWIEYAAETPAASSGSMAVNSEGELVGIHGHSSSASSTTIGYVRPIEEVRSLVAATLEGEVGTGDLLTTSQERILCVVYGGADGVNLRNAPSLQAAVAGKLYSGDRMYVIVPGESDHWWAVYDSESQAGWVRDSAMSGLQLARVETREFSSVLQAGEMAEVMCLNPEPGSGCLCLRSTPGWRAKPRSDIVTVLDAGAMVQILEGSREIDGLVWWRVLEIATGLEGWVAEVAVSGDRTLFPVH